MGQRDLQSVADIVPLDEARQRRNAELDEELSTAGGMLRAAREAMGLTAPDVAARTNIKLGHVEAIEAMQIGALPAQPYTMGFVRAYAREVSLPEAALMQRFRQQAGYETRDLAPGITPARSMPDADSGRQLSLIALLAIMGVVLWSSWHLLIRSAPTEVPESSRFAFSKDDQEIALSAPVDASDGAVEAAPETGAPVVRESVQGGDTAAAGTEEVAAEEPGEASASVSEAEPAALPALSEDDAEPVRALRTNPIPNVFETPPGTAASDAEAEAAEEATRLVLRIAPQPDFPPLCEAAASSFETVTITFSVGAQGTPVNPRITDTTNPCFNGVSLAALEGWRYDSRTITDANSRDLVARFNFRRPS